MKKKLCVEYNELTDLITINGVQFSGDSFRCLPDPKKLCKIVREKNIVSIRECAENVDRVK